MVLTEKQNEVFDKIKIFIDSDPPVFILRGYAGTGKYTINMENGMSVMHLIEHFCERVIVAE